MKSMINAYRENSTAAAEFSDPHRLISMLFDGALERIARAIGHVERGETAAKGECIGRAVGIIEHLRGSLDPTAGDGSLASNLESLYDYMTRRLTEAILYNDVDRLREVRALLERIRDGWAGIPQEQRGPRPSARENAPNGA
jgi:flagellar protein FliS